MVLLLFCLQMSKMRVGGYRNRFVKQDQIIDILVCKICHAVNHDPYETQCYKTTFCKSCIDKPCTHDRWWMRICPMCRIQYDITKAMEIYQCIPLLDVYCEYEEEGCRWRGKVKEIDKHMKECYYLPVPCEYHIVGCKAKVARPHQIEHNQAYIHIHFSLVLDCVKELNYTKQQLKDSERELAKSNHEKNNQ